MLTEIFQPKKEEIISIRNFPIKIHKVGSVVYYPYWEERGYKRQDPMCVVCNYEFEYGDLCFRGDYNKDKQLCIREHNPSKICIKCGIKHLSGITPKRLMKEYKNYIKTMLPILRGGSNESMP